MKTPIYIAIIISLIHISTFALFEPVTDLGRSILQSSEHAAHDLASRTIDAAKLTKTKAEEVIHHPTPAATTVRVKEMQKPTVNRDHPHLRNVNNTYTQVR